jgi:hypothetical protein
MNRLPGSKIEHSVTVHIVLVPEGQTLEFFKWTSNSTFICAMNV